MWLRAMGDKVIIRDLRAHGIIGIYQHERETPQEILINVTVFADTRPASQTDDIADCVRDINESFEGYIKETKIEEIPNNPRYKDFKITF